MSNDRVVQKGAAVDDCHAHIGSDRSTLPLGLARAVRYPTVLNTGKSHWVTPLSVPPVARGNKSQHRRLSEPREALVTRAMEEKYLARRRMTISGLKEEIRIRCLRASLKPVSRKAIEMRIARLDPGLVKRGRHGAKAAHDAFGPASHDWAAPYTGSVDVFTVQKQVMPISPEAAVEHGTKNLRKMPDQGTH